MCLCVYVSMRLCVYVSMCLLCVSVELPVEEEKRMKKVAIAEDIEGRTKYLTEVISFVLKVAAA